MEPEACLISAIVENRVKQLLHQKHREWVGTQGEVLPEAAYIAALYGVRQLASDALDTPTPDLPGTRDSVAVWVSRAFAT